MSNPVSYFSPVTKEELHKQWKDLSLDKYSWAYCYSNGMRIRAVLAFLDERPMYARELIRILDGEQVEYLNSDVSIHQLMKAYAVKFGSTGLPKWFREQDLDKQCQMIQLTLNYQVPLPNEKELKWLGKTIAK